MIDRIIVSPYYHLVSGHIVVVLMLIAGVLMAWAAFRQGKLTTWANGSMIVAQIGLMVQALLGIKLLDQGMGVAQLYIHYVGGLAPLLFFMLIYWIPLRDERKRARFAAGMAGLGFLFALMAFTIGGAFARGELS
ncbi:MAG: hypothetical protein Fur005_41860 [Roseiflexaceae bacterium]